MKRTLVLRERLAEAGLGAYFRPRDIKPLGVSFHALLRLVAEGEIEKVGFGQYRLTSLKLDEFETVAMVSSAIPDGIVCLLTALRVHEIGTQSPHEVWMAISRKARKPVRLPAKVRIVRFSGAMLTYGVISRPMMGVSVRITSPARTIVDCFRYRNKVGIDVALEAVRDGIRSKKVTMDEISRTAEVCRARTVVWPYLEVLSA
jgi:predicted transcriptional regulator of viral defense system